MISVEEALENILKHVDILETEHVPILDSLGQVLAEDITSATTIPPLDNTAMDGYAVRSSDTLGAGPESPRLLRVIDTVSAGLLAQNEVTPGTAVRIMTGAPIPEGADSIVRFEDTDEEQRKQTGTPITEINILCQVEPGQDIRRAGEDVRQGVTVLRKGTVIRPSEIGVMASVGRTEAAVIRRPVVAILATGNELVEIGQELAPGKIYNSNTYSVASLIRRYGGIPKILGVAPDTEAALVTRIRQGLNADILITTGGVSTGDYDIVKDILAREGEVTFWKVRMKPGKPIAFGRIKGSSQEGQTRSVPLLGLPGNPVSSMVTFEIFARPAIFKMMGKKNFTKPAVNAILEDTVVNTDGRRVYSRVIVEKRDGRYFARLTGGQGSGILTSMSLANGLAILPEDKAELKKGETARVVMLDWNEEVSN